MQAQGMQCRSLRGPGSGEKKIQNPSFGEKLRGKRKRSLGAGEELKIEHSGENRLRFRFGTGLGFCRYIL